MGPSWEHSPRDESWVDAQRPRLGPAVRTGLWLRGPWLMSSHSHDEDGDCPHTGTWFHKARAGGVEVQLGRRVQVEQQPLEHWRCFWGWLPWWHCSRDQGHVLVGRERGCGESLGAWKVFLELLACSRSQPWPSAFTAGSAPAGSVIPGIQHSPATRGAPQSSVEL